MAKNYAVRAGQRISVRHPFLYHGESFHGKGHLWDLSASGWRATGDQLVTQGMVMPVYIELPPDGEESKYLFIESAIVRWSSGCVRVGDPNDRRTLAGQADSVSGSGERQAALRIGRGRISVTRFFCIHREPRGNQGKNSFVVRWYFR